jgi:hypothetical protein
MMALTDHIITTLQKINSSIKYLVFNVSSWFITSGTQFRPSQVKHSVSGCNYLSLVFLIMLCSHFQKVYDVITFYENSTSLYPYNGWSQKYRVEQIYLDRSDNYGVYCPGSQQADPNNAPDLLYSPPYIRGCVEGFYCAIPHIQYICMDIVFNLRPDQAVDCCSGTYKLGTQVISQFPIYVNDAKSLFLGYDGPVGRWKIAAKSDLQRVLSQQDFNGVTIYETCGSVNIKAKDTVRGWPRYTVSNKETFSPGIQCPFATMLPKPCPYSFYCPRSVKPLRQVCADIVFNQKSGVKTYGGDHSGTYKLDTRILNGFPIYVNAAKDRFLGYDATKQGGKWAISNMSVLSANGYALLASSKVSTTGVGFASNEFQLGDGGTAPSADPDPTHQWYDRYDIYYGSGAYNLCPQGWLRSEVD